GLRDLRGPDPLAEPPDLPAGGRDPGPPPPLSWVETHSASFTCRHDTRDADDAVALLDRMELFRSGLDRRFFRTPGDVSIILHPTPFELSLAQPWLPLARRATAPAARRYLAGWFSAGEIHVLSPR